MLMFILHIILSQYLAKNGGSNTYSAIVSIRNGELLLSTYGTTCTILMCVFQLARTPRVLVSTMYTILLCVFELASVSRVLYGQCQCAYFTWLTCLKCVFYVCTLSVRIQYSLLFMSQHLAKMAEVTVNSLIITLYSVSLVKPYFL